MRQFQLIREDIANRALLMGRMMFRLDVDLEAIVRDASRTRLRSVANVCRGCRQSDLCQHWLDSEEGDSGYRDFCPNASVFDAFRRH
jgi:Family of unknown function (DUF6455)